MFENVKNMNTKLSEILRKKNLTILILIYIFNPKLIPIKYSTTKKFCFWNCNWFIIQQFINCISNNKMKKTDDLIYFDITIFWAVFTLAPNILIT